MTEMRTAYCILVRKYEGTEPLRRSGHRLEVILKSILSHGLRIFCSRKYIVAGIIFVNQLSVEGIS